MTAILEVIKPTENGKKFPDDPFFSVIVPIYDKETMVLKRCLLSLADQDYLEMEVILVMDGPNAELQHVAEGFVSRHPERFRLIEIPHGGACAARNAGFQESKGEIVSFVNSDYILKPGTVKLWVDSLIANPDCGFAYGGYEYATAQRYCYPSKPFDTYLLTVANYIDCGFPLWRKYVVPWDVDCKSLQDWDFWLRVVKTHNVKGFYLGRDYTFVAEPPRSKGLSDDSSNNWIDRVHYIKSKNGIPEPELMVTSFGAPNHGIEIAKILGADFRDDTWNKPSNYKAVYLIGFYMRPGDSFHTNDHPRLLAHFPKTVKKIVHFVGADIYFLRKFPYESLRYLAGALNLSVDHILCENQAAQDELKDYGIKAEIVPIPSYTKNWEIPTLPDEFRVGLYLVEPGNGLGQSDFDKYCYEATLSIVRAMPDIKFSGYGKGGWDVRYPNLQLYKDIPRDKWPDYVYSNSALLRLIRHDTKPLASNEFMIAGRDVISNIKGECTDYIDTSGQVILNEFDKFSEGLNPHNWPDVKTKIVQKIREIKKRVVPFEDRLKLRKELFYMRDHATFKKSIEERMK